jgi:hypothetical protein
VHPFVCPASRCTYRFTGHVTKTYVSDSNQSMVAYWSVYGDLSPNLYMHHIVICGPSVPYFFTLAYKQYEGIWEMLLKIKCVF